MTYSKSLFLMGKARHVTVLGTETDDSTDRLDFDAPDCNDDCRNLQPHPYQRISQIFGKLS